MNARVRLEQLDDVVDESIYLSLIRAGREAGAIVNAGKLSDPDGLAVAESRIRSCRSKTSFEELAPLNGGDARVPVMVDVCTNASHAVLVDVDSGHVPRRGDLAGEGLEPAALGSLV